MITIKHHGRLGNAMLKNCAASILAKKFDLQVAEYLRCKEMQALHPNFYTEGTKIYETQIEVKYTNLLKILQQDEINYGLGITCFCQEKTFVKNYRNEILDQFSLQYDPQYKDDLFVHVRLGDCIKENRVPDLKYYVEAVERTKFIKGYISSDSPSHEIVTYLMARFNLTLYEDTPAATINFAKNFGSLVLSKGTFSWWMGVLSQSKNIFYPKGGPTWHGDIFVFDEWTPISFK
jgi:hypothetical protein